MDKSTDSKENKGRVWLVGAGPGDRGLMTLRGKEVMDKADVVIYDALVGGSILSMIPESAEKIYVGKRSGKHTLNQSEINELILSKAEEGLRVVRLKGGDPFVFGRGGEEIELLAENGIPYEIVPGISSAFAVPAYAGIPVTHRDFCSGVHVITGHRRKDHTYDIDFVALTEAGGTIVFLMGVASLPSLMNGLLSAGMDPDTPAAVIEKGTTAGQRTILSTVSGIAEAAAEAKVTMPAVIVAGDVAALAENLAWKDMLPLAGVKAVVTRPKELSSGLASMLREKGAEVIELPTIDIRPRDDDGRFALALKQLRSSGYEWVVLTSPSGVRVFIDALTARGDIRSLAYCRIAAMGKGTEKELLKYGIRADLVPTRYDGKTLGSELARRLRKGDRVLIPRAEIGGRELTDELADVKGVTVDDIPTYSTVYVSQDWFDAEATFSDPHTYAVFTSASTVKGLVNAYPDLDHTRIKAVCIGEMTAAEAEKHGMRTYVSDKATLEALASKLEEVAARSLGKGKK